MVIRSKAPLRLGFGGGGTDVDPYCSMFGGAVLNATIDLFTYCTIIPSSDSHVVFESGNSGDSISLNSNPVFEFDGRFDLHKGVHNKMTKLFKLNTLSYKMVTYSDAPPGSGLGSSSALVVAMIKAFAEWHSLPLGEYDMALLAFEIERFDVGLAGGRQDQYASTFGGFNFMEFSENNVVVNPLRIKQWIADELQASLVLYYTGVSRDSANIIIEQQKNVVTNNIDSIESMHSLKNLAYNIKESILKGDIKQFADYIGKSWINKKRMAKMVSNSEVDKIFNTAIRNGAITGKISGAGGGGFIMFLVDPVDKHHLMNTLGELTGKVINFNFSSGGCHGWKIMK